MQAVKRRFRVAVVALMLIVPSVALLTQDHHRLNGRYLLWRYTGVGDWRAGVRFLNVDVAFRDSLSGKGRGNLLRWFPNLVAKDSAPWLTPEQRAAVQAVPGEWIAGTDWFVRYDGDAVAELILVKGV